MRRILLALVITTTSALAGLPAFADSTPSPKVVYLDSAAALEQLRTSNPAHYAKAERIMAAANVLCRPGRADLQAAKKDAAGFSCAPMLLRTSNPPKRQITFRLDDTRYVALVTVTDDPPQLVSAQ